MAGDKFEIVNWKIENFSCWNQALHGKCISISGISLEECSNLNIKLYPRGTSGLEEYIVVQFSTGRSSPSDTFSGVISFIGADGSVFCTQRVHFQEKYFELSPGPKFEELILKSGECESEHKDQLTLRLQVESESNDETQVRTIIHVCGVHLEIDRSIIQKGCEGISFINYSHDDFGVVMDLKTGEKRDDIKMKLRLDPRIVKSSFSVKAHLRWMSSDGSLLRSEINQHLFHDCKPWILSDSLSKEELSKNVRSLILHLKIVPGKVNHISKNVYSYLNNVKILPSRSKCICEGKSRKTHNDQENAVHVLSKELMCLYQDQDFSDLQLKCESVSFSVHKAILSARSTVFKTMLSSDMTEAVTGCVDIEDLDAATLARFLAFLYTGAVEDLQGESALKLYYAADKYHVPSLKTECVGFLSANVSFSNVCDVLSFGDKHQDGELTAAAHDFILRNYNEVLKSKEWNSFMSREPLLSVKTLTRFGAKNFVGNLNPL